MYFSISSIFKYIYIYITLASYYGNLYSMKLLWQKHSSTVFVIRSLDSYAKLSLERYSQTRFGSSTVITLGRAAEKRKADKKAQGKAEPKKKLQKTSEQNQTWENWGAEEEWPEDLEGEDLDGEPFGDEDWDEEF